MEKVVAFIEFNKEIEKKIFSYKKEVRNIFGNQIFLNHPVHSTLFSVEVQNWKIIKSQLKNIIFDNNIKIKIGKAGIFNKDIFTNGKTLYFEIIKNKKLFDLQKLLLSNISVITNKNQKYMKLFKSDWMKKNYKIYGWPYVGKHWIPHVTIASIKNIHGNNKYFKLFLKEKINLYNKVTKVRFYKVVGENHIHLFDLKLN